MRNPRAVIVSQDDEAMVLEDIKLDVRRLPRCHCAKNLPACLIAEFGGGRTDDWFISDLTPSGGKMGSPGSVAYLFERKGVFSVDAKAIDEDTLMGIALDAGADDLKRSGSTFDITCEPATFAKVQEALKKSNIMPVVAEISQVPKAPVDVDAETGKKVVRLMEALDDQDDAQNVYSNVNISEEMVAGVE